MTPYTLNMKGAEKFTGGVVRVDRSIVFRVYFHPQALPNEQCHQPKLQPCPRQAPRSSQPPWPSGDDQASAAQSGGLAGLAVM